MKALSENFTAKSSTYAWIMPAYKFHSPRLSFCNDDPAVANSYTGKLNFFPCSTLRPSVSPVHAPWPEKHSLGVINPEEI